MSWYEIFPRILNMSLTASVIICFVLLCRLCFKRAPKIYSYALWSVVLFRLLCPVSFSAPVSLLGLMDTPVMAYRMEVSGVELSGTAEQERRPLTGIASQVEYIPSGIVHERNPEITLPVTGSDGIWNTKINENLPSGDEQEAAEPLEDPVSLATYLWLFGILTMISCGGVSYFKVRRSLTGALKIRGNVYLCDHIPGPFVMGIARPKIYLSSALNEQEYEYVILHETHHIRRGDPVWKLMAYLAVCVHWFNPLVWLAFRLFVKDMEMSCDEAVVKKLGTRVRADYAASLLQFATGQKLLFDTPLAFGEKEPAGRIRNLSRWKRPTVLGSVTALLVCVIVVIVCGCNPRISGATLRMSEQACFSGGNAVTYEVNFKNQVQEMDIYVEAWEKGVCRNLTSLNVDRETEEVKIFMRDHREDGAMTGVDVQVEADGEEHMAAVYAKLPETLSVIGWAFNAYEEGDKIDLASGEEKILAAMAFDVGDGVRVFDVETLLKEPERLEKSDYMLVVRAVFDAEQKRELQSVMSEVEEENSAEIGPDECMVNDIVLTAQPDSEKISIWVQPDMLRRHLSYSYIPDEEEQQWIEEALQNCTLLAEGQDIRMTGKKECGWTIWWQEREYMAFTDGTFYYTSMDEKEGLREFLVENPKLCDYIQSMLCENLAYGVFDPTEIQGVVSAKLGVQGHLTNQEYYTQTITDPAVLNMLEEWFSHAEYILGGVACDNQSACLTFTLADGSEINLSVAADSCPNFAIHGVYYDYRPEISFDNREFFELFDEIPWYWLEEAGNADNAVKAKALIAAAEVNARPGYESAVLTYVENDKVNWDFNDENPWETEEMRDALAQAALKELYNLTGYQVKECTYTTDGRSRFIFGKSEAYIGKSIAFYSRDYGYMLAGDSVPFLGFVNARRAHYSDVQQLDSPYHKKEYSGAGEIPMWFLTRSGLYQGETITGFDAVQLDDTVYTHINLNFDGGYYKVVMDEKIESVHEVSGPYLENNQTIP